MNANEDYGQSYTLNRNTRTLSRRRPTNESSIHFAVRPTLSTFRILYNKFIKNGFLILSMFSLIFIYYFYMFVLFIIMFSGS